MESTLGHNPDAGLEERQRYTECLSTAKFHPDPAVRKAAQASIDAYGKGPNINDFTPEERETFEFAVREQSQNRARVEPQALNRNQPTEVSLSLEQLRALAHAAGHDLVPKGDKPIAEGVTLGDYNAMKERAVTAEKIAADAVHELDDLKSAGAKKE